MVRNSLHTFLTQLLFTLDRAHQTNQSHDTRSFGCCQRGPCNLTKAPIKSQYWCPIARVIEFIWLYLITFFLSACIWPFWTVKWDRLVPSFNSCQHLLIMARTVLIKRGTHLPLLLALHWLTEPHGSTGWEDHGEQKAGSCWAHRESRKKP